MAYTLQLLDSAGNVVFDLNTTGTTNPHEVQTAILESVNLGVPTGSPAFFQPSNLPGGFRTHRRDELVEGGLLIECRADTQDDLWSGINELTEAFQTHAVLKYVRDGSSQTRYIDLVHATVFNGGFEGDVDLSVRNAVSDVTVTFTRQPYLRGDLVTSSEITVNNDPAHETNGRVFSIDNQGNAPAPLETFSAFSSEDLDEQLVALLRPAPGFVTATYLASEDSSHFIQAEDMTNGAVGDVSSVADAAASGGFVKRTTFASATTMTNRFSYSWGIAGADPAAFQGAWDVYLRAKVSASPVNVMLAWGVSSSSTHESEVTFTSTSMVEKYVGRVYWPQGRVGLVSIWAERPSGSGNLDVDFLVFVPTHQQARITTPSGDTHEGVYAAGGTAFTQFGAAGSVGNYAAVKGPLPLLLNPGSNVVYLHGSTVLTATTTVEYSYYPRFYT